MKRKQPVFSGFHCGASLLLVIFLFLCLSTLATLSLSTALRNQAFVEKSAQKTAEYYRADALATELLCQKIEQFRSLPGTQPQQVSYQVPVNDRQLLFVSVLIYPEGTNHSTGYEILSWKEIPARDWTGEDSLPVLPGK